MISLVLCSCDVLLLLLTELKKGWESHRKRNGLKEWRERYIIDTIRKIVYVKKSSERR
ncbi:hypothetical protein HN51_050714, partial [Arachis hypogaea]